MDTVVNDPQFIGSDLTFINKLVHSLHDITLDQYHPRRRLWAIIENMISPDHVSYKTKFCREIMGNMK